MNLTWERLLPAMQEVALPDDTASQVALTDKLSRLILPPVQGQTGSPTLSQISNRTYTVDANDLAIQTITLGFDRLGCTVSIKTAAGQETIPCGYGVWRQGETAIFNGRWASTPMPVATSGAWTAEDSFTMLVRLYETPFYHTVVFHFFEDGMMFESRVNITIESTEPLLMTAHPI